MARQLALTVRGIAIGLGFIVGCGAPLTAQTAPAPAPAKQPPPTAAPKTVAAAFTTLKPGATNAAAAIPPGLQNTLNRYGNIVGPSDQVPYPLKLRLPNPNEAEIRVPKPEDLDKRQKLEALATLSDDDIRKQLEQWPAYSKMSLRDQASMLGRIQDFRDYHSRTAMQKAHDMGLLTLTPEQRTKFEKEYWDKRLKLDQDLAKQFQPVYQARVQKMDDELFREFSLAMPAPAPPKPGAKPAPAKPIAGAPGAPAAKNAPVTSAAVATNPAPLAQAPH